MSEREGSPGEKGVDPVYAKLWQESLNAEGEIVFYGNTTAAALDKYLATSIARSERLIEHPNISEQYRELQTREATKHLEYYRTVLNGSYYKEKPAFCQEQADKLTILAGERTDDYGIAGRKQASSWLRTKASCLEMPEAHPPVPEPQEKTE